MRYFSLVILICLIQPALAFSAPATCPNVSNFGCLVKNSRKVFLEDYDQWWKIYNYAAEKAEKCTNYKDTSLFFRLWSGYTDGEMSESLFTDTGKILAKNSQCFFEGWLGLPAKERTAFISQFCPMEGREKIINILKQAMKNPRYKFMATQLLRRAEGVQCKDVG